MNRLRLPGLLAGLCCAAALAGCAGVGARSGPQDTTKFTVGNTERFVALDAASEAAVECTGLQERTLADGRIEVVANLKNRGARPVRIEIACAFADAEGTPAAGPFPWQALSIGGDATEVVRFTAPAASAVRYAIRVRDAR